MKKTYYHLSPDGTIAGRSSDIYICPLTHEPALETDREIVLGYDGKLYFADEAPIKPEELIQQELSTQARAQRDSLLAATDYLVMPDYPLSDERRDAVIAYRQALRDVPGQAGFPENITWPDKP